MQEDYEDVVRFQPCLSKDIDKDEYFLSDRITLWFFELISTDEFDLQYLVNTVIRMKEKAGKKINLNKIKSTMKANIKEVCEVDIVMPTKKEGFYKFDSTYLRIVKALEEKPLTLAMIKDKLKDLNLENDALTDYLHKLEVAGYIKKTWDLLAEENSKRLIELISQKPKTLKEIMIAYNDGLTKKNQKSENTIYRYIKNLESAGLVVNAGKRVYIGKNSIENLYTTAAYIFLTKDYDTHIWQSDFGINVGKLISMLLSGIYPTLQPKPECIRDILYEISKTLDQKTKEIIDKSQLTDEISNFTLAEINAGYRNAALIAWFFEEPDRMQKLIQCISDKNEINK